MKLHSLVKCRRAAIFLLLAAIIGGLGGCYDDADKVTLGTSTAETDTDSVETQNCPPQDNTNTTPLTEEEALQICENLSADALAKIRLQSNPSEYVATSVSINTDYDQFFAIADRLFGSSAKAGDLLTKYEIQPGVFITSEADPRTTDQVIITIAMDVTGDASPHQRIIFKGPASFSYGGIYLDTVAAAMKSMAETVANDPSDAEPYRLEYRIRSSQGGNFTLALDFDKTTTVMELAFKTPTTSLIPGKVNTAYKSSVPYESIYGMVNFTLSRDQFDFFSTRAYGLSAGKNQNFTDFQLLPHKWLRLTVIPKLDDEMVSVGFEVVTQDNRRIEVARAPASILAGEQFKQNVLRMVDNMETQEAEKPGSSRPWEVPFYYDDPNGGGVVEVIANGHNHQFEIAYAVETPINELLDVDFVPYQGSVVVPADWNAPKPTCAELGSKLAFQGNFSIQFNASSTVRNSKKLDGPLKGNVYGSIYRAEDVTIMGPNEGAVAVAALRFTDVDVTDLSGSPIRYHVDEVLPAGNYQILGFMDVDGNTDTNAPDPDVNDPVMIPIGGFEMQCEEQPITVEYALLLPEGY